MSETARPTHPDLETIRATISEARALGDLGLLEDLLSDALTHPSLISLPPKDQSSFVQELISPTENVDFQVEQSHVTTQDLEESITGEMTPEQEIILETHRAFDQFEQLPTRTKDQKNAKKQFFGRFLLRSIQNPTALRLSWSVWQGRMSQNIDDERILALQRGSAFDSITGITRREWQTVSSEQLQSLLRLSSIDGIGSDIADAALRGYFQGPKTKSDTIQARSRYAHAVLDLALEPQVLERALLIGNCETEILARDSDFNMNIYSVIRAHAFDAPKLSVVNRAAELQSWKDDIDIQFGEAIAADMVLINMMRLTRLPTQEILKRNEGFFSSQKWLDNMVAEGRRMTPLIPAHEYIRKLDTLHKFYSQSSEISFTPATFEKAVSQWPLSAFSNNDLYKKYLETAGPLLSSDQLKTTFLNIFKEEYPQYTNPQFFTFTDSEGHVLEFCIPTPDLMSQIPEIMQAITETQSGEIVQTADTESYGAHAHSFVALHYVDFQDHPIEFWYRTQSPLENPHPVDSLQLYGLPEPDIPEGSTPYTESRRLSREIMENQRRFLFERGVQIPLDIPELESRGYEHIVFRKDGERIAVELKMRHIQNPFSLHFSTDFQLDLEGKTLSNPEYGDLLLLTFLRILRPILCDEPEENNENLGILTGEMLARCGHFRNLPSANHHFSSYAASNYFLEQGRDLAAIDQQKRSTHPEGRGVTYVRKLFRDGAENLPPIKLPFPNDALEYPQR